MIRIAFSLKPHSNWVGGISYFENLFAAINLVKDPSHHHLVGVVPEGSQHFDGILHYLDETIALPPSTVFERAKRRVTQSLSDKESLARLSPETVLSKILKKNKVDVVFMKEDPLANFGPTAVCWIPDFQFLHLPEMYKSQEIEDLKKFVSNIAKYSDRIVLNSQAVLRDFEQAEPRFAHKAKVIPFVAYIHDDAYKTAPESVRAVYNLPEKFFYLPNQFWKHKNHQFALQALVLAREIDPNITIVCSGPPIDYRNPGYSSGLMMSVSKYDLRENFIILGLIPRDHVYALLRQSLAVIQPSLFEGWSSSVEEAKSLGKPVLLSGLDTHREQAPALGDYFDHHDPQQLADLLVQYQRHANPGPAPKYEQRARDEFIARSEAFGEAILDLMLEVA